MNNKFLPGAVLFIIAFVLSSLAALAQVKAQNTFYGYSAGFNTTGINDSAFGEYALYDNTSGNYNTASGAQALYGDEFHANSGNYNTATGANALYSNTAGNSNTATGTNAL